ncbi:hypothetical protein LTR37_014414 [Vermiconidia calcicola]|uniref:Uncharacterized protein n=1 Tax=Vermiconidia calcicola TaxID=1690605 RepID=A0ACC3MTR6_9PEZI|nr:hypothetical protein LTR37_014414 [Vermiconidia calcicola]
MKALIYNGLDSVALVDRPIPKVQSPTDAIIKLTYTSICETDLHILKGHVPTVKTGTIIGHEGVGVVSEIGAEVKRFVKGDRVLISCMSSCGSCTYCQKGMYAHCSTGGWTLGNTLDGTQAQYVRVILADGSLHHIPDGVDETALVMFSDNIPEGFECGTLNGRVQPGSTVAIIGAGGVGLSALMTALLYSPSVLIVIENDPNRLKLAGKLGALRLINPDEEDAEGVVKTLTGGVGCEAVIEAGGNPETFELAQKIVAPGGTIANTGFHAEKVDLHLETLWYHHINVNFSDIESAYRVFGSRYENSVLKMVVAM